MELEAPYLENPFRAHVDESEVFLVKPDRLLFEVRIPPISTPLVIAYTAYAAFHQCSSIISSTFFRFKTSPFGLNTLFSLLFGCSAAPECSIAVA